MKIILQEPNKTESRSVVGDAPDDKPIADIVTELGLSDRVLSAGKRKIGGERVFMVVSI